VAVALWIARRDARRDKRRQQHEAEQQMFAVASVVVAEARYEDPETWYPEVHDMPGVCVTIHNLSDEPVLFPRLERFVHPEGGTVEWSVWEPPGSEPLVPSTTDVLAAKDKVDLYVDLKITPSGAPELRPVIGYTDRHNQRWRRRHGESPYRVPAEDIEPIGGPYWYRKHPTISPAAPADGSPALPSPPAQS
jgi:hypothetical protein